ncbi:MAG: hypothetical protein RIR51_1532 [Bacteroidota bacterium]
MFKKIFSFLIFIFVSQYSWAQFSYRNNCIDSCSSPKNSQFSQLATQTVFEPDSVYGPGHTFQWSYGDGTTGIGRTGFKSYTLPGTYPVVLTVINQTNQDTLVYPAKNIIIGKAPVVSLNTDSLKEICTGESVTIKLTTNQNLKHRWFPNGEIGDEIIVNKEGCYSVKVFSDDNSGCYAEKSTEVKICGSYPNAFDPTQNGDGSSGGTSADVRTPQWNLGDSLKVLFPANGIPAGASSDSGPYIATDQVAYYPLDIKGAKYILGALNTNGQVLADNQGRIITNNLNGDINLSQGTIIFPKKSCKGCNSSDYYIITSKKDSVGRIQIFYSLVDISDSLGKGNMLVENRLLQSTPAQAKILVQTFQSGYGLFTFDADGSTMRIYIIDESGISRAIETNLPGTNNFEGGTAKFSRDGTKLAMVTAADKVTIFDLSNDPIEEIRTLTVGTEAYGLEFSPNGSLLYVSTRGTNSSLFQFYIDTLNTRIESTKQLIGSATKGEFGAMAYDPVSQAKLFISVNGEKYFATIGNPNQRLNNGKDDRKNLNYFFDDFKVNKTLGWGVPNSINDNSGGGGLQVEVECKGLDFSFKLSQDLCQQMKNTKVKWDFYKVRKGVKVNYFINDDGVIVPDILNFESPIYSKTKSIIDLPQDPTGGLINGINQIINVNQMTLPLDEMVKKISSYGDPSGTYVVLVHIWNDCVEKDPKMKDEGYLLDAQQFDLRFLFPYRLKDQIDKIYNNILGNASGLCDFDAYPIDTTVVQIPSPLYPIKDNIDLAVPLNNFLLFNWSTADTSAKIEIKYSTEVIPLSLTLTDFETGCTSTQDTKVKFISQETLPADNFWYLCMDDPMPRERLTVFNDQIKLKFNWVDLNGNGILTTVDTLNFIDVNSSGEYQLTMMDDYNCSLDKVFKVGDRCKPKILSPNIFTPNGDGENDRFFPTWNWGNLGEDISLVTIPNSNPIRTYGGANRTIIKKMRIYNRWGQIIYQIEIQDKSLFDHSDNNFQEFGWDGKVDGVLVPQDTYVWEVIYESVDFPEMGEQLERGSVIVIY